MSLPFPFLCLLFLFSVFVSLSSSAASAAPICPESDLAFLRHLAGQCPSSVEIYSPSAVDGDSLDKELSNAMSNGYYSILFYASWCPFSSNLHPIFDVLSSMFPQIKHLLIEDSTIMPSVLSKYGIHSFPALFLFNGSAVVRHRGARDLNALIQFYKKSTGFNPISYMVAHHSISSWDTQTSMHQTGSPRELMSKEPYVVLAALFIFLKIVLSLAPIIYSHLNYCWASRTWRLNVHFLGELNQLLLRVLHLVDIKKLWSKLKLSNGTRNLREGANNAHAWASTLASVSLGEPSSPRVASSIS
ncbi:5'-adenylylsulfate reductase-like 5 [Zingiber officinale]|uniref:5'-adenylylsulfate reductase-like 5 n=1 Tax=Zingiber officinale TaxID=94328 RepID=UPI001C4CA5D8|nr:5'-adenylylsulfate reductase-like 5 [Zingiber officinale]